MENKLQSSTCTARIEKQFWLCNFKEFEWWVGGCCLWRRIIYTRDTWPKRWSALREGLSKGPAFTQGWTTFEGNHGNFERLGWRARLDSKPTLPIHHLSEQNRAVWMDFAKIYYLTSINIILLLCDRSTIRFFWWSQKA